MVNDKIVALQTGKLNGGASNLTCQPSPDMILLSANEVASRVLADDKMAIHWPTDWTRSLQTHRHVHERSADARPFWEKKPE
jgi:hypothetical protein